MLSNNQYTFVNLHCISTVILSKSVANPLSDKYSRPAVSGALPVTLRIRSGRIRSCRERCHGSRIAKSLLFDRLGSAPGAAPESFTAWLDRRQAGEPVDPGVRAADSLAESTRRWRGVNPVVIDASADVELAADTLRGRALWTLLPTDAVPWVPKLFFVDRRSRGRPRPSGSTVPRP
jgi:hypothetical protein